MRDAVRSWTGQKCLVRFGIRTLDATANSRGFEIGVDMIIVTSGRECSKKGKRKRSCQMVSKTAEGINCVRSAVDVVNLCPDVLLK